MNESELKKEFGKTISQIIIKRCLVELVKRNNLTRKDVRVVERAPGLRRHYHFGIPGKVLIVPSDEECTDFCLRHPVCVVMDVNQETKRTIVS